MAKSTKTSPKKAAPKKAAPKKAAPKTALKNASSSSQQKGSELYEFFCDELKDIYWAEKHISKTLPKMRKATTNSQLADAFANHLEQTKEQITRLEQVFELLGKKAQGKKCEAIVGIVKEGEDIIEETKAGTNTRDVGLILAGQKVEHYEIATYGGLATLANTLGLTDVAELLATTLEEEKEADSILSDIAEHSINEEAAEED